MLGGSWEAGYQRAGKQAKQAKQAEQAQSAHQSAASVQPPPTGLSIPFQSVPEQSACSDSVPFRSIPFRSDSIPGVQRASAAFSYQASVSSSLSNWFSTSGCNNLHNLQRMARHWL